MARPARPSTTAHPTTDASWALLRVFAATGPLLVGAIPWGPKLTYDVFHSIPHLTAGLLVGTSLTLWVFGSLLSKRGVRAERLSGALALLILFVMGSAASAHHLPTALTGDAQNSGSVLAWAIFAGCAFLGIQHVSSGKRMESLTRWVVGGAAILGAITLIQRLTGIDPLGLIPPTEGSLAWMSHRGTGTLGNPDFVGNYLAATSPLALSLALRRPDGANASAASSHRMWAIAFIVIGIGAIGALARGAWLALLVGTAIVLFSVRSDRTTLRRGALIVAGTLATSILIALAVSSTHEVLTQRFSVSTDITVANAGRLERIDALLSGRLGVWAEALDVTKRHPLLGVGPANYRFGWYGSQGVSGLPVHASSITGDPHSLPLLAAATLGAPAALLLIALVGYTLLGGLRSSSIDPMTGDPSGHRLVYAGWVASLTAAVVASLLASTTLAFLALLGIMLGVTAAPGAESTMRRRGVHLATGAGLAALTLILALGMMPEVAAQRTAREAVQTSRLDLLERSVEQNGRIPSLRLLWVQSLGSATISALISDQAGAKEVSRVVEELDDALAEVKGDYELAREKAFFLARVRRVLGDTYTDPAIRAARDAMAVSPIALDVRTQLASILLEEGDPAGAAETLATVWDRDRTDHLAGLTYIETLIAADRLDDARVVLETLDERFPDDMDIRNVSGRLDAAEASR